MLADHFLQLMTVKARADWQWLTSYPACYYWCADCTTVFKIQTNRKME